MGANIDNPPIVLSQKHYNHDCIIRTERQIRPLQRRQNVILEAKYDKIEELSPNLYLAYMGNHPLVYRADRNDLLDFFQIEEKDFKNAEERIMNWVLPGLQFFYRDTDSPIKMV